MSIDLNEMMLRLCAMEEEVVANSDAFPDFFLQGESKPYWTNRLAGLLVERSETEWGEEQSVYEISIVSRLVVGHITEGVRGEVNEKVLLRATEIIDFFNARPKLQSEEYPTGMDTLDYALCTGSDNGLMIFPPAGGTTQQVGMEFRHVIRSSVPVDLAYH